MALEKSSTFVDTSLLGALVKLDELVDELDEPVAASNLPLVTAYHFSS